MSSEDTIIRAPFSKEQADSLNEYQRSGLFHEFTCDSDHCRTPLFAEMAGWRCPLCGYTQDWAHAYMADGSWRAQFDLIQKIREGSI